MSVLAHWPHLGWPVALYGVRLLIKRAYEPKGNSMNTFLKACLKEAYDLEQTGAAALSKTAFAGLLPLLIQDGEDLPALIANWADAKVELGALVANPAADADLVAYGLSLGWSSDKKVQAVIADVAALVLSAAEGIAKLVADLKA